VNKATLGTILGVALLGLAKSKGSSAKGLSLDDFFKKKVGNQNQTYRVYFEVTYKPFWDDDGFLRNDFRQYIGMHKRKVLDFVSGFEDWLTNNWVLMEENGLYYPINQEPFDENQEDIYVLFETWCDIAQIELWYDRERPYAYDDYYNDWADKVLELKHFGDIVITNSSEEYHRDDVIEQYKEESDEELDEDDIDWDIYVEDYSGYIAGYVDVLLDVYNAKWDKGDIWRILSVFIIHDYHYWLYDNGEDENDTFEVAITKVEPDIFAKKKSNLRIR